MLIGKAYIRCFHFEASIDFYRTLLKQDGLRIGSSEYAFDLGGAWLACIRAGGHEQIHQPLAIVLSTKTLPTPLEVSKAGGRHEHHFPFTPPAGETLFATDPDGNAVCFVLNEPTLTRAYSHTRAS